MEILDPFLYNRYQVVCGCSLFCEKGARAMEVKSGSVSFDGGMDKFMSPKN
jgi:hypothetical protein